MAPRVEQQCWAAIQVKFLSLLASLLLPSYAFSYHFLQKGDDADDNENSGNWWRKTSAASTAELRFVFPSMANWSNGTGIDNTSNHQKAWSSWCSCHPWEIGRGSSYSDPVLQLLLSWSLQIEAAGLFLYFLTLHQLDLCLSLCPPQLKRSMQKRKTINDLVKLSYRLNLLGVNRLDWCEVLLPAISFSRKESGFSAYIGCTQSYAQ